MVLIWWWVVTCSILFKENADCKDYGACWISGAQYLAKGPAHEQQSAAKPISWQENFTLQDFVRVSQRVWLAKLLGKQHSSVTPAEYWWTFFCCCSWVGNFNWKLKGINMGPKCSAYTDTLHWYEFDPWSYTDCWLGLTPLITLSSLPAKQLQRCQSHVSWKETCVISTNHIKWNFTLKPFMRIEFDEVISEIQYSVSVVHTPF